MKCNAIVVGAGALGRRHAQGLIRSKNLSSLYIVDPSVQALSETAALLKEGLNKEQSVTYLSDLKGVPKYCDLAIIATTAKHRLEVLIGILDVSIIKNIILEKVAFQSVADLDEASRLLDKVESSVYVNCPRRAYPVYQSIFNAIHQEAASSLTVSVCGNQWGMACNAVHFLDLAQFFTGQTLRTVDVSLLDDAPCESKRRGFYEIFGTIFAATGGALVTLSCAQSDIAHHIIDISTEKLRIRIDEISGHLDLARRLSGGSLCVKRELLTIPLMSDLITDIADSLFFGKRVPLTSFAESYHIHHCFLSQLSNYFKNKTNEKTGICPIT